MVQPRAPSQRYPGQDGTVLAKRDAIYADAKRQHLGRWSGSTRNWAPRRTAWLNPDQEDPLFIQDQRLEAACSRVPTSLTGIGG
ncbi:hypothetical protein [Halomonas sp. AOP35-4E-18]|uniref:hypothetical protein n=1 Tax=Halomonas sp. AOP35-4E-18 TaxID=3457686 RepID=UPI0040346896